MTVKDKLRRLLGTRVSTSFSVEKPSSWILERLGKPPNIYSAASSLWLLDAAIETIKKKHYDMVFISTTDYVFHKFEPESEEAKKYMQAMGEKISQLNSEDTLLGIVSDHGMNRKRLKIDLEKLLLEEGIVAQMVPIIKDEYEVHHQNLGGSVYLYLTPKESARKAQDLLRDRDGVEVALTRNEAAKRFLLPADRIGDLLVLAGEDAVFSQVETGAYQDVDVRSHGSLHERDVPFIINQKLDVANQLFNKDLFLTLGGQKP